MSEENLKACEIEITTKGKKWFTDKRKAQDRIKKRIKKVKECWEWQGVIKDTGYGSLSVGSRLDNSKSTITSHRFSYMVFNGPLINNNWVLHTCHNKKCVNPKHLYQGTSDDNIRDRMERGRIHKIKEIQCPHSKLDYDKVVAIRKERLEENTLFKVLAEKYGLKSENTVSRVCSGKSWRHVSEYLTSNPIKGKNNG